MENQLIKAINNLISELEGCNQFIENGEEPDEYYGEVFETYTKSKIEIKLLLTKLGFNIKEIEKECPILNTDFNSPILNSSVIQSNIGLSIYFLKALIDHIKVFENKELKPSIKKYKKSFEIEGGLPFLKGKYKKEER